MSDAAPERERGGFVRSYVKPILEALVMAFLVITFVVNTVGISGASMHPTLQDGERAFVPKYETWLVRAGFGAYDRGDVVYFRPPADAADGAVPLPVVGRAFGLEYRPFYIKRVIGIAGDRVRIDRGVVFVNDVPLDEPYLEGGWRGSASSADVRVPAGHVYVLGDNRGPFGSVDSRRFGPIPNASIAGRASAVIWPPLRRDESGTVHLNVRPLP